MPRESRNNEGTKALLHVSRPGSDHQKGSSPYLYGRVVAISLSTNDVLYKKYNVLEAIEFEPVQDRSLVDESGAVQKQYLVAYKMYPSVRTPVINEIVPLFNAPALFVQSINSQFSELFYYTDPVGVYTSVEHNAAPDENTIQSLNNPNSSQNKIGSYKNSTNGITSNKNGSDTILSNDTVKLGEYFTEKGIKNLAPLEGDYKLEGRFGNSIRFGGTPSGSNLPWIGHNIGSPVILIRNGQFKVDSGVNIDSLYEDINNDGSSIYFLSDQTIELVLGSDNFDSYNKYNDNSSISSQVIVTATKSTQNVSQSATNVDKISVPIESSPLPVTQSSIQAPIASGPNNELDFVPDNEDDLNFVQIGEDIPVPLTQGLLLNKYNSNYQFVNSINGSSTINLNLVSAPTINLNYKGLVAKFSGKVSSVPSISKNGKALVDLIALTEGTMGQGNFNGYDIMVTGKLMPGYNMANASPQHPNIKLKTDYNVVSSASGRYQFIIDTWNVVMGKGTPMSKFNQDYACWKNILNSAGVPSVLIDKIDSDPNSFEQVINMLASQWASLPVSKDPKGLYKQAGRFSFSTLFSYYKQILSNYP